MFHYAFSNDLRFDKNVESINNFIEKRARLWLDDAVPPSNIDKSLNNTSNAAGGYFNLKSKGNCARAAIEGNTQKVILNFIKKFQYPNPMVNNMKETIDDGIMLAPLRTILKLLYIFYINENGYMTYDEIKNFIFYNKDVALDSDFKEVEVYNQIIEYRKNNKLPDNIASENEREWKQEDRQLGSMLNIMIESKCIIEEKQRYRINYNNLSTENKAEILDIITFNDYWREFDDKKSYFTYFEIENSYKKNVDSKVLDYKKERLSIIGENRIYYGAPGTGKSHTVDVIAEKEFHFVHRTTFYPEYTHDDFVGSFMPVMNYEKQDPEKEYVYGDGTPSNIPGKPVPFYKFIPGPFANSLVDALNNPDKNVLLIVEELNRANAAAVFGEVFQLLDRKYNGNIDDGESRYNVNISNEFSEFIAEKVASYNLGEKIRIPSNMSIYATMNSADQGVNPLDSAFKRRWNFVYVPINFENAEHKNEQIQYAGRKVTWQNFGQAINRKLIELGINEDKLLGEYFVNKVEIKDVDKFETKIISYMFEDIFKFNRRGFFKPEYKTFLQLKNDFAVKEIFDIKFDYISEEDVLLMPGEAIQMLDKNTDNNQIAAKHLEDRD